MSEQASLSSIDKVKTLVTIDDRSLSEKVMMSLMNFSVIGLLIYVSRDSGWWTLVTGGMFLFYVYAALNRILKKHVTVFKTKQEAIDYLNSEIKKN